MKKILFTLLVLSIGLHTTAQNKKKFKKLFSKAINAANYGDYDNAIDYFDAAIKESTVGYKPRIMLLKGMTYQLMDENELAIKAYDQIIKYDYSGQYYRRSMGFKKLIVDKNNFSLMALKKKDSLTSGLTDNELPYATTEKVPVYPGCDSEKGNMIIKKCMEEKITQHVNSNFNTELADLFNLSGIQKINIQFKIDTDGNVVEIISNSKNRYLGLEARRVINELKQMKPGIQKGKPVRVIYSLPIKFEVRS